MKAISPILATLLLIVIAVSAIVITYAWVTTFLTGTTTQVGQTIKFDSVHIGATGNNVTIYVRNWGTEDTNVDKVYIDGQDFTSYTNLTSSTLIRAGGVLMIKTTTDPSASFNFVAGSTYKVKVTGPNVSWEESVVAKTT